MARAETDSDSDEYTALVCDAEGRRPRVQQESKLAEEREQRAAGQERRSERGGGIATQQAGTAHGMVDGGRWTVDVPSGSSHRREAGQQRLSRLSGSKQDLRAGYQESSHWAAWTRAVLGGGGGGGGPGRAAAAAAAAVAATPGQSRDGGVASTRRPWRARGASGKRGRGCSRLRRRAAVEGNGSRVGARGVGVAGSDLMGGDEGVWWVSLGTGVWWCHWGRAGGGAGLEGGSEWYGERGRRRKTRRRKQPGRRERERRAGHVGRKSFSTSSTSTSSGGLSTTGGGGGGAIRKGRRAAGGQAAQDGGLARGESGNGSGSSTVVAATCTGHGALSGA